MADISATSLGAATLPDEAVENISNGFVVEGACVRLNYSFDDLALALLIARGQTVGGLQRADVYRQSGPLVQQSEQTEVNVINLRAIVLYRHFSLKRQTR